MEKISGAEARDFIESNEKGLQLLGEMVSKFTHVDNFDDTDPNAIVELKARKHARVLIEEWITELFSLKTGGFTKYLPEDDNIFHVISKEESTLEEE